MGYRESISLDSPSAQNWLLDPKTNEQSPKIDPQRQYSTPIDQKSNSKNLNRTPEAKKQTSEAQNYSKMTLRCQNHSKGPKIDSKGPKFVSRGLRSTSRRKNWTPRGQKSNRRQKCTHSPKLTTRGQKSISRRLKSTLRGQELTGKSLKIFSSSQKSTPRAQWWLSMVLCFQSKRGVYILGANGR